MKRGLYIPPRHFGSNGGFFGRKRDSEQDNDDTLLSSIAVHLITCPNDIFGGLNWSWMFFWRNRLSGRDKKLYQHAFETGNQITECSSTKTLTLMVTSSHPGRFNEIAEVYLLSMGLRELVVFCHILHVFSANTQSNTDSGLDLYVWLLSLSHPISHQRWQSRTILDHRTMGPWLVSVSQTLSKWYKAPSSALRFACLAWWFCGFFHPCFG